MLLDSLPILQNETILRNFETLWHVIKERWRNIFFSPGIYFSNCQNSCRIIYWNRSYISLSLPPCSFRKGRLVLLDNSFVVVKWLSRSQEATFLCSLIGCFVSLCKNEKVLKFNETSNKSFQSLFGQCWRRRLTSIIRFFNLNQSFWSVIRNATKSPNSH